MNKYQVTLSPGSRTEASFTRKDNVCVVCEKQVLDSEDAYYIGGYTQVRIRTACSELCANTYILQHVDDLPSNILRYACHTSTISDLEDTVLSKMSQEIKQNIDRKIIEDIAKIVAKG